MLRWLVVELTRWVQMLENDREKDDLRVLEAIKHLAEKGVLEG